MWGVQRDVQWVGCTAGGMYSRRDVQRGISSVKNVAFADAQVKTHGPFMAAFGEMLQHLEAMANDCAKWMKVTKVCYCFQGSFRKADVRVQLGHWAYCPGLP